MRINCAIVDDNCADLANITKLTTSLSSETDTIFEINTFANPKDLDFKQQYDLYILDIDMPELNGFALANTIYKKYPDSVIVFCSNHDDLVFDSFKLNAFYFVRKNFLNDDLVLALRKYIQHSFLLKAEYIYKTNDTLIKIPLINIVYFEVARNDLYIHTTTKEYHERKSLKQLKSDLHVNYFIQISQNFLVNAHYIEELSENKLIMKNSVSFDIPRRLVADVKKDYLRFLSR